MIKKWIVSLKNKFQTGFGNGIVSKKGARSKNQPSLNSEDDPKLRPTGQEVSKSKLQNPHSDFPLSASAFRVPHSDFRLPHFNFCIPHSAFCNLKSTIFTPSFGIWNLKFGIFHFSFLIICACLTFVPDLAYANSLNQEALKSFAEILSLLIKIFTGLALLMIQFGGDLLGTELITGEVPMQAILPMWRFVRNLVNIIFVLFLLYLAFANLYSSVGGEGSNWTIKDKLPKVILAMIAVNFSLLGFRVVIDAVHVGTISILSISDAAIEAKGGGNNLEALLTHMTTETGAECTCPPKAGEDKAGEECNMTNAGGSGTFKASLTDPPKEWLDKNRQCKSFRRWINNTMCDTASGPKSGMLCVLDKIEARNIGHETRNIFLAFGVYFQNLEKLPALAANQGNFINVAENVLFSMILGLMYCVALVAVFVALIVRVLVLWLILICSPALVAVGIMGISGGGELDFGKKVITHLIMPLKIAGAFALSFVMVTAMMDFPEMKTDQFLGIGEGALSQFGVSSVYGLMWKLATIIIFWRAAFWAIKDTEATFITDKIKSVGETAGKFAAGAASDMVQLPMPGGDGNMSLRALSRAPQAMMRDYETNAGNAITEDFKSRGWISPSGADAQKKVTQLKSDISGKVGKEAGEVLHKSFMDLGTDAIKSYSSSILAALPAGFKNDAELKAAIESGNAVKIKAAIQRLSGNATFTGEYSAKGAGSEPTTKSEKKSEEVAVRENQAGNMRVFIGRSEYNPDEDRAKIIQELGRNAHVQEADWERIANALSDVGDNISATELRLQAKPITLEGAANPIKSWDELQSSLNNSTVVEKLDDDIEKLKELAKAFQGTNGIKAWSEYEKITDPAQLERELKQAFGLT